MLSALQSHGIKWSSFSALNYIVSYAFSLLKNMQSHSWVGRGWWRVEGLSKVGKGLMDTDNRVVIAGGEGSVRGLNGNGKNTIKIK